MDQHAAAKRPDFIDLTRAGRIVAPICDGGQGCFEAGIVRILHMVAASEIAFELTDIPSFQTRYLPFCTRAWFDMIANQKHDWRPFAARRRNRKFVDWAKKHLRVCRNDIIENLVHPSGGWHEPITHFDSEGIDWSFPEALAWLATGDLLEVARISYADHFGSPQKPLFDPKKQQPRSLERGPHVSDQEPFDPLQSDAGRRLLMGWLVIKTSLFHCKCGAQPMEGQEPWEACQCIGKAYSTLRKAAEAKKNRIPKYSPKPRHGSFTLSWPKKAHLVTFPREEILRKRPPVRQVAVKGSIIEKCREWLEIAIQDDCESQKAKPDFFREAQQMFAGQISKAAFNGQIWPEIAVRHGRTKAGRKVKIESPN